VEKTKVAGEGGLDGDLGGLEVAGFADHDAVWVLAEEGAQDAAEVEADAFVDGDLDDALDVVLDGVLGGEELRVDGVDLVEAGVKGGGLAGAGGACDDEDAVGLLDGVQDVLVDVLGHAERSRFEVHHGAVEDAEHDAFAELGGKRRDAEIDLASGDDLLDAAILREAALGDVEIGHDLDARDDGQGEVARGGAIS
jgi:hypothetical protein